VSAAADGIAIRIARPGDADAVAAIYNHYVATSTATFELAPVDARAMAARIADIASHGLPWLLAEAEEDGAVLGYAYAGRWRTREGYRHSVETSIYLAPEATGRGLGGKLYRHLLELLPACGVHAVIGGIALPNPASEALHERLGFEPVARFREVGRKFGQWIDVAYWQRCLPGPADLHSEPTGVAMRA
jgi:phosphinothricin acetyltransferase